MKEGWIPTDPREAVGICTAQAGTAVFDGSKSRWHLKEILKLELTLAFPPLSSAFPPSATGKGDGVIDAAQLALYPWPPAKLVHAAGPVSLHIQSLS